VTPPCVRRISGDIAAGGEAILLRFETDGEASEFSLARSDLGCLLNMLLALSSIFDDAGSSQEGSPLPLAIKSLSIGETADGEALLGIEIGGATLEFGLPQAALGQLARTPLTLTASRHSEMQ
jgi:hypothetical protein